MADFADTVLQMLVLKPRKQVNKKEYLAEWYQQNKDQQAVYYADWREKLKKETVEAYGGHCRDCGETDFIVLNLDHIENDSQYDRKLHNHRGGYRLYAQLKRHNWPRQGYQLLCCNCNFRKEYRRRKDAVNKRQTT